MLFLILDTTLTVVSILMSALIHYPKNAVEVCMVMVIIDLQILFVAPSRPITPSPGDSVEFMKFVIPYLQKLSCRRLPNSLTLCLDIYVFNAVKKSADDG